MRSTASTTLGNAFTAESYKVKTEDYKSESSIMPNQRKVINFSDHAFRSRNETSTYLMKENNIKKLEDKYIFENPERVKRFLGLHDITLIDLLYEAEKQIKRIFSSNIIVDICLELYQDYEDDYEGLSVIIKTNLSPKLSLDLLEEFDEKWWLNIDNPFLSIMVRPV